MVATMIRWLGALACLFMLASFIAFVHDQSGSATTRQVNILDGQEVRTAGQPATEHHSDVRRKVDDVSGFLAKPFKWLTDNTSSQWVKHIVTVVLGLLVYGLCFFWLARVIPKSKPKEPSVWET